MICIRFLTIKVLHVKVKKAKISNRYNQVPHLTRDTMWESDKNTRNQAQEGPFLAGAHKAARNRQDSVESLNMLNRASYQ